MCRRRVEQSHCVLLWRRRNLGPALINDGVWTSLFGLGESDHNGIVIRLVETTPGVNPVNIDQLGNPRPANLLADIGAIETGN